MPQPPSRVANASAATISRRGSKLGCMAKTSSSSAGNYNDSPAGRIAAQAVIGEPEIHGVIPVESAGLRLDQALARLFPQYSRSRLQAWLKDGALLVEGVAGQSKRAVSGGEKVAL